MAAIPTLKVKPNALISNPVLAKMITACRQVYHMNPVLRGLNIYDGNLPGKLICRTLSEYDAKKLYEVLTSVPDLIGELMRYRIIMEHAEKIIAEIKLQHSKEIEGLSDTIGVLEGSLQYIQLNDALLTQSKPKFNHDV